jgi:hypothetical protein
VIGTSGGGPHARHRVRRATGRPSSLERRRRAGGGNARELGLLGKGGLWGQTICFVPPMCITSRRRFILACSTRRLANCRSGGSLLRVRSLVSFVHVRHRVPHDAAIPAIEPTASGTCSRILGVPLAVSPTAADPILLKSGSLSHDALQIHMKESPCAGDLFWRELHRELRIQDIHPAPISSSAGWGWLVCSCKRRAAMPVRR